MILAPYPAKSLNEDRFDFQECLERVLCPFHAASDLLDRQLAGCLRPQLDEVAVPGGGKWHLVVALES